MADDGASGGKPVPHTDVAIIGAGFAGLGMAIKLRQANRDDFVVLERSEGLGGTWRDNTYPGCACDVPSQLYSFSFAPNPDWSHAYSGQAEIRRYMERCAEDFAIRPFLRFGQRVVALDWDEARARWLITTADGARRTARVVVAGTGPLNKPAWPDLPGLDRFAGPVFHSARWDHGVDLRAKRVAVIGTGASAIQFVPEIARRVAHLDVYQRTPPWIIPRLDYRVPDWMRGLYRRLPVAQKLHRGFIYWSLEWRAIGFTRMPGLLRAFQWGAERFLHAQVADPDLRARLTPDYRLGCKRVLLSDDYYPALQRDHVDLITDRIAGVTAGGVIDTAGVERPADALILGTGFRATEPLDDMAVTGRGGRTLAAAWADTGAEAHRGTTVSGFPNLFLLVGPNTGLGHSSIIFIIESQIRYVLSALDRMDTLRVPALDVRADVQARYNAWVQRRLARTVWQTGGCTSWYQAADGKNVTLWPGFTVGFRRQTARLDPREYVAVRAQVPGQRSVTQPVGVDGAG
ncbi:cation diffusion facilitator CzcD-associated flavoprotein CzcO [Rhodothalassium salexigens DSM 2132]|uniref:Trimethylamine monooxygenase n=1 Tax=Rhodothalassium salexigens DSM 2132 TaxID=1188247 RepID=A0A4V2SP65_RHOSA|nr:NAD(P)/FAD-dependent oxidoreductase [Rhodothalassium salexigens]MBB4211706.1 cation diffusion facilitator CzcD-associated flavoprotein CzcO [Rhodothalassium salexigens DSM 2132]MBK1639168.1 4-hydroxyacetophenone monooxygenase [Rhodothalassium salexigens DSM 2132]TCP33996.1 cation diffusion facilitator CzcD-associated flavoprotein CzcO [Rhodothalassium salexigens DSM 2132]